MSAQIPILQYQKLGMLLELVIHNEQVVEILKKERVSKYDNHVENAFTCAYRPYINDDKQFHLLTNINSLALAWLFSIYH